MSTYQFIDFDLHGRVCLITLNRPELMNAWHEEMRAEVVDALERVKTDDAIGAVVFTGAGDRAFSAGQDLNESTTFDDDRAEVWIEEFRKLYSDVRSMPKPTVSAINGVAAGSAFQFVLLTDYRVGNSRARMGQPEINSGIASITGPWIMREILGLSRTIEMTLSGRILSAEEALALGLLHEMVATESLLERAIAYADDLASKPPLAMRLIKERFWEVLAPSFHDAFDSAIRYHRESYGAGEPQQVGTDFLAERAARKS